MLTAASRTARGAVAALAVLAAGGCAADPDLTLALDGGANRRVTTPPALQELEWTNLRDAFAGNDSLLPKPHTLCWAGDRLAVVDRARQRVVLFDARNRPAGMVPAASSRGMVELAGVSCAPGSGGGAALLLADQGAREMVFADTAGTVLRRIPAPMNPQGLPLVGETTLGADGSWFVSWLGTRSPLGPYLSDAAWRGVPLVEKRAPDGSAVASLGTPVAYRNTVARRALNHVYMAGGRDTLWVLTQGDATIRGFDARGAAISSRTLLPVHFRGREPKVTVREPLGDGMDFRYNTYDYHPNVGAFTVLSDSLFAVVRFRDWGMRWVGSGGGSFLPWASSAVEVYDRRGNLRGAFDAPGMISAIAAGAGMRLAIVSRHRKDGSYHAYAAKLGALLPAAAANTARVVADGACPLPPGGDGPVCSVAQGGPAR